MSNITNKTFISKMKRFTLLAALGLCSISLFAQDAQKEEPKEEGFVFTTVKELPITSVKNQSRLRYLLVLFQYGLSRIRITSYGKRRIRLF